MMKIREKYKIILSWIAIFSGLIVFIFDAWESHFKVGRLLEDIQEGYYIDAVQFLGIVIGFASIVLGSMIWNNVFFTTKIPIFLRRLIFWVGAIYFLGIISLIIFVVFVVIMWFLLPQSVIP